MFNKSLDDINFEDIENLITQGVLEYQNLEYKKEVWGMSDSNKKEMLKDIVSMANSYGGYLIIGVEEDGQNGKATAIVNIANAEGERDRILNTLFANIQPRISLKIKVLENNGVSIIVINIPNSFRKPHIITFQGLNQFWIRHDRGKMLMTIDEIEDSVINTVNLTKNIDSFFKDRRNEIIRVGGAPTMVIGVYPVLAEKEMVDISDTQLREYLKTPPFIRSGGADFTFTYVIPQPSYNGLSIGGGNDRRKVELYRSGYLEGQVNLSGLLFNSTRQSIPPDPLETEAPIIPSYAIIESLFSLARQAKQIYSYLGYDGQIFVSCSLFYIQNLGLRKYRPRAIGGFQDLARWRKDHLEIQPLVFTEIDDVKIAKTIGDRIWQSFGFENEPFFDGRDFRVE